MNNSICVNCIFNPFCTISGSRKLLILFTPKSVLYDDITKEVIDCSSYKV